MKVETKQVQGITVVELAGEIDGRTAPLLQEQLLPMAEPGSRIVLDMSEVGYMSSAGLRILLLLYRHLDANEGRVVLASLEEMIHDTMAITGFLDFFVAYETVSEGIEALQNAAEN